MRIRGGLQFLAGPVVMLLGGYCALGGFQTGTTVLRLILSIIIITAAVCLAFWVMLRGLDNLFAPRSCKCRFHLLASSQVRATRDIPPQDGRQEPKRLMDDSL